MGTLIVHKTSQRCRYPQNTCNSVLASRLQSNRIHIVSVFSACDCDVEMSNFYTDGKGMLSSEILKELNSIEIVKRFVDIAQFHVFRTSRG